MDNFEKTNADSGRVCPECKCALDADAKFCGNCGARCEIVPEQNDAYDPFDYPPEVPYSQIERQRPGVKKFCGKCGNALDGNEKFCGNCGAPTGITEKTESAARNISVTEEPEEQPTEQDLKRRKRSGLFASIAACAALLGILFTIAPFLGFSYDDGRTVKTGLALIWTMLGGGSELAETGVGYEVLRFAGWAYVFYIIAAISFGVSAVVYSTGKKDVNPLFVLPSAVVLLAAGVTLLVLDIIACAQIEVDHGALFMGGIGVFVFALIAFALALTAVLYSVKTYKKKKSKKVSGRAVACVVAACVAVVFSTYAVQTPAKIGAGTDFPLWEDSYGFAYVDISERVGAEYLGMTVIHLRDLEKDETYRFSVTFGSLIYESELKDCLGIYADSAVSGLSAYDVATSVQPIATNQTYGMNRATITFRYTEDFDIAIAIVLGAKNATSVRFTYGFDEK